MRRPARLTSSLAVVAMTATAFAAASSSAPAVAASDGTCAAPADTQSFEMAYIDTARAGGEPIITRHPDGQLLWGSHAGTTHFYSPSAASPQSAAFAENYEGQTYYYVSDDNEAWDFVPRTPVSGLAAVVGAPATGFSDPEFAIEQDGTVYVSEINLANIAVSKSEDGGHTYELVNAFAFTSSDRQWMAADRDGELYMAANGFGGGPFPAGAVGNVGHFIAKSTDGGLTWGAASTKNRNGEADIQIDHDRGILYELSNGGGALSMAAFTNIREEAVLSTVRINTIAAGANAIDPTFDLDDEGNLYASWYAASSDYGRGVFYAASSDQGLTWSAPVRVDTDANDEVWPWIAVGATGEVTIAWLQNNFATTGSRPGEAAGTAAKWHVMVAHSDSGLGCEDGTQAAFNVVTASSEPVHTGTICQHGTVCQADLTDRRLGDYFAIEVGADGRIHVAVSDTRQGGAIALPLHLVQTGGPRLFGTDAAVAPVTGSAGDAGGSESGSTPDGSLLVAADGILAATGGGAALASLSLLGLALVARRRD